MSSEKIREFTIIARSSSAARFRRSSPPLITHGFPTPWGAVSLEFRTRYAKAYGFDMPRELWAEIRGPAPNLREALEHFPATAAALVPFIALSANARVGHPDAHLGFESTPGATEREFFESFLPDETGLPMQGRGVDVEATMAIFRAVGSHRDFERLLRASTHYLLALERWHPRDVALALAHLFMGMEALKDAALRKLTAGDGRTEAELCQQWGIPGDERNLKKALLEATRREVLFRGDVETHNKARLASDMFEHGFESFGEVISLAKAVRNQTASYLRRGILETAEVDEEYITALLAPKYERPVESWRIVQSVWGLVIGEGDELAASDEEYPILTWSSSPRVDSYDEETGRVTLGLTENMKVKLADGMSFQPVRYEVAGPTPEHRPVAGGLIDVTLTQPNEDSPHADEGITDAEE
jgi:hypothetical protein